MPGRPSKEEWYQPFLVELAGTHSVDKSATDGCGHHARHGLQALPQDPAFAARWDEALKWQAAFPKSLSLSGYITLARAPWASRGARPAWRGLRGARTGPAVCRRVGRGAVGRGGDAGRAGAEVRHRAHERAHVEDPDYQRPGAAGAGSAGYGGGRPAGGMRADGRPGVGATAHLYGRERHRAAGQRVGVERGRRWRVERRGGRC